jgi:hypothetical protein
MTAHTDIGHALFRPLFFIRRIFPLLSLLHLLGAFADTSRYTADLHFCCDSLYVSFWFSR